MMFCRNCGQQVPNGAKFCQKCGTPVLVNEGFHPQENGSIGEEFQRVPPVNHDSWNGWDIFSFVFVVLACLFSFGYVFHHISRDHYFLAFTMAIRCISFVLMAFLIAYNMRGQNNIAERNDIFLCFQVNALLLILLAILDKIAKTKASILFPTLVAVAILPFYYFRLGKPETLFKYPVRMISFLGTLLLVLEKGNQVRKQIKSYHQQQNAAIPKFSGKTATARLFTGIISGVIQIISLFLPMYKASAGVAGYQFSVDSPSFIQIMMQGDETFGLFIVSALILGSVMMIILHLLGKPKGALIPVSITVLGALFMLGIFFEMRSDVLFGNFYQAQIGFILYVITTIAALIAPFI